MNRYELIAHYAINYHHAIQRPTELAPFLEWVGEELGAHGCGLRGCSTETPGYPLILELGSDAGGTLFCWRMLWPEAHVVSVSLQEGPYATSWPCDPHGATAIEGDTHDPETLALVVEQFAGGTVDLLFVDADHTLNGCTADVLDYGPLVRPGGLIALHDVSPHTYETPPCEVDKAWERLLGDLGPDSTWHHPQVFDGGKDYAPDEPVWGGIGTLRKRAQVPAQATR